MTAEGHDQPIALPASFALIQKNLKYFFWPNHDYEQLFDTTEDPFEERDILSSSSANSTAKLDEIRARFQLVKLQSQSGFKV